MYKKLTALTAALLITAAGCGKIDDQGSNEETETTSQAEEVTEEAVVNETVSADDTAETTPTTIGETTEPVTEKNEEDAAPPANDINVLSALKTGMTEEEALAVSGMKDHTRYEENLAVNAYEYEYAIDCDNVFGTGLPGYMFAEFDLSTHKLICCGYHLGRVLTENSNEFTCSEEQLSEAYNKIKEQLTAEYGEGTHPQTVSGEGIREELTWEDGPDHIWTVYGIDLWGENSGVNEIVVSRSIDR